jgi:hypothetical protein
MLIVSRLLVDILFAGGCGFGDKTDACNTILSVHKCAINASLQTPSIVTLVHVTVIYKGM